MATPTGFGEDKKFDILSSDDRVNLQERAGQIAEGKLENLIAHPEYKKLSDEEKAKKIISITDKSRIVARAEKVQELVEGLEGDELKGKLKELKTSGFLTKEVYDTWADIF